MISKRTIERGSLTERAPEGGMMCASEPGFACFLQQQSSRIVLFYRFIEKQEVINVPSLKCEHERTLDLSGRKLKKEYVEAAELSR